MHHSPSDVARIPSENAVMAYDNLLVIHTFVCTTKRFAMEFNRYTSSANILFISDPEGPKFQWSGACIVPSEIYRKTHK